MVEQYKTFSSGITTSKDENSLRHHRRGTSSNILPHFAVLEMTSNIHPCRRAWNRFHEKHHDRVIPEHDVDVYNACLLPLEEEPMVTLLSNIAVDVSLSQTWQCLLNERLNLPCGIHATTTRGLVPRAEGECAIHRESTGMHVA